MPILRAIIFFVLLGAGVAQAQDKPAYIVMFTERDGHAKYFLKQENALKSLEHYKKDQNWHVKMFYRLPKESYLRYMLVAGFNYLSGERSKIVKDFKNIGEELEVIQKSGRVVVNCTRFNQDSGVILITARPEGKYKYGYTLYEKQSFAQMINDLKGKSLQPYLICRDRFSDKRYVFHVDKTNDENLSFLVVRNSDYNQFKSNIDRVKSLGYELIWADGKKIRNRDWIGILIKGHTDIIKPSKSIQIYFTRKDMEKGIRRMEERDLYPNNIGFGYAHLEVNNVIQFK